MLSYLYSCYLIYTHASSNASYCRVMWKHILFSDSLFETTELKTLVDGIVGQLGSDASEQACESECHTLIQQDHLLQFGCPIICKRYC